MTENERVFSRRSFVKAAVASGAIGAGLLGGSLQGQVPSPTANLYKFDETTLSLTSVGDVAPLKADKWKFIIPVPQAADAPVDKPRDLVAFSDTKISHFKNDGNGKFTAGWNKMPSDADVSLEVAKLKLGRNACAGRFSKGSLLDLFAQSQFDPAKPRQYAIWRITATGITRLPVELVTDFPFDDRDSDLQHIVAGKFFKDMPNDDLIFYQGNRRHEGDTGILQILKLGFALTPRLTSVRSSWTTILPCPSYDAGDLTRLLFFDDGRVLENRKGRDFVAYPTTSPFPMSPWVEVRRPTRRGHLELVEQNPQPLAAGEGPNIIEVGMPPKPLVNRGVVASPAPRIKYNKMKLITGAAEATPDTLEWWTVQGHDDVKGIDSRIFFLQQVASGGRFIQMITKSEETVKDTYHYRVLDRNLLHLDDKDFGLPEDLPRGKLVIPGRFVNGNKNFDLLFYEA